VKFTSHGFIQRSHLEVGWCNNDDLVADTPCRDTEVCSSAFVLLARKMKFLQCLLFTDTTRVSDKGTRSAAPGAL
jgi:hypothetical protein